MAKTRFKEVGTVVETDKGFITYGDINEEKGTQHQKFKPKPAPKPENPVIIGSQNEDIQKQASEMIKKGYFQNKTTGKFYDKWGNEQKYTPTPVPGVQPAGGTPGQAPKQSDYGSSKEYAKAMQNYKQGLITPGVTPEAIFDKGKDESELEKHMKTYGEQAEEQFYGQFLTNSEQAKKFGIKLPYETFEEFMEWRKNASEEDMAYLEKQQAIAGELEASQAGKAAKDIEAAEAATIAGLSPGREGVTSAGAPMVISEFTQEMERRRNQITLERQSAQLSRDRAKQELERAQEAGDIDLAQAIQGQIASIEQNIRQIDTEALQAATLANEQAMKAMEVASQKTATVTENLFNLGSIASTLSYDQLQNMIVGTDMTMPQALAIQQAAVLQGKALETKNEAEALKLQAQAQDLLATAGKTTEQMNFEYFNQLSDADKSSYLNLKRDNPNMQLVDMGDGKYGTYDPVTGKLAVTYSPSNLDQSTIENIFFQEGGSRITGGWGDNMRQCGEAYNDITEGTKVGDNYTGSGSKMAAVTKRDNPQIGNGIVIPIGSASIGHIGTVIEVNGDTIRTVEWNHNGDGKQTVETYSVSQLNQQYGDNWGFTDSKLKEKYQKGLNSMSKPGGSYTSGQRAVMDNLDPAKIDSTDLKILEENGLSTEDFYSYISTYKKPLPQDKKDQIQTIIDGIAGLEKAAGKSGAVGFGLQKYIPGFLKPGEGDLMPGTSAAAFAAKFNSFRDNLALPALDSLKGAMSDKDIQFLRNSATALSLDMPEEEFDAELKRLKDKYSQILNQGTDISPEPSGKETTDYWYDTYNPLYDEYGLSD